MQLLVEPAAQFCVGALQLVNAANTYLYPLTFVVIDCPPSSKTLVYSAIVSTDDDQTNKTNYITLHNDLKCHSRTIAN